MYTDAYDFKRSSSSQSVSENYVTYSRKDYNYLPDTNQSVYTNTSLSLVTFDLSSIYNSSRFTDTNDLVAIIPITLVAAVSSHSTLLIPVAGSGGSSLLSLKSNYINLIHQADIQINGKTCNDLQPYTNVLKSFEMLSEMSPSDLQIFGSTYGLGEVLDNPRSVRFNQTAIVSPAVQSGTGLCNNTPFVSNQSTSTYPMTAGQSQLGIAANTAISSRLNTFVDTTQPAGVGQKLYGAGQIMGDTRLNPEFKPYYEVKNGFHVWYDYAIIRLGSILESLRNIGLTRRFDAVLRLYVNTGTIAVPVETNATAANIVNYGPALQQASSFTNTCPFTINWIQLQTVFPFTTDNKNAGTAQQITAGCYIGLPPATNVAATTIVTGGTALTAISLGASGASHTLRNCRIYYSSIEIADPQKALTYTESNRAKKVVYRNFVSNFINNVPSGGNFSSLIQSGLVNPVAVVVFPFIQGSSLYTTTAGHVSQYGSPYDTNTTGGPTSLINFQVTVGGVNQLNTTLQYTFETFMQHVSIYDQLTGTDFGISCGLFDRKFWEMNRAYVCMIRSKMSDMDTPRNINISFQNNSGATIDLMVFCVYLDSLIIDVDTGRITR